MDGGRLFVRSRYANMASDSEWVDTGDLVEQRGDRFHFIGRADNAVINIGGQKAVRSDIEAHIRLHPEVQWVRVNSRKAPLVGSVVTAEVVLREQGGDLIECETRLIEHCLSVLPDFAVPRLWSFLDSVPMRGSLKS